MNGQHSKGAGKPRRRRTAVVAGALALMLGGGVAVAAWLVSGTGDGSAKAASAQSLTVAAGTPTASLYPKPSGGYPSTSVGAVYASVNNPNPFPVRITNATFGAITVTPITGRTCAASYISAPSPVTLATPVTVAANATAAVTVPGALEMSATAENGCQGANITVQVTLSGESA